MTILSRIVVFGLVALAFCAVLVPSAVTRRAAHTLLFAAQSLWEVGNAAAPAAAKPEPPATWSSHYP